MIKEAKNLVRDLAAAITPAFLATNDVTPMDVNGSYDWNAQAYNYDVCKFEIQTKIPTKEPGWTVPTDATWDTSY